MLLLLVATLGMGCQKNGSGSPQSVAVTDTLHWNVNGTDRKAIVYIPASAKTKPTPVIFNFHGFGVQVQQNYKQHRFDTYWPDAIVVWPQGLTVPGEALGLPAGPGWQLFPGQFGDRDLDLFDAILGTLKSRYNIDDSRLYATGHSNGGGFTMLLWATRGDIIAATGPSAAPTVKIVETMLKPKPLIQITGTADSVVSPSSQFALFDFEKKINSWTGDSVSYAPPFATFYTSSTGNPSVLYKHSGGHIYPSDAIPVVVKFFQSIKKQ